MTQLCPTNLSPKSKIRFEIVSLVILELQSVLTSSIGIILQTSTIGETKVVSLCFIDRTILYEISECLIYH
ncbi:hypothetical protein BpHYR1_033969 [Brachionus plicatilis]|uniref:Uncharacterized protein n=1 Tax=Brachionus plicatilis TaxID=10195 RepID=A0A3M7SGC9_BRAPC|nr:hypothetical protein BpHYR1_033969 [Brachionus plicatilis]